MGRTVRDRVNEALNEAFRQAVPRAMKHKFGITVKTEFNIVDMNVATYRPDGQAMSREQHRYMEAFEAGYKAAWDIATLAAAPGAK